jgi:hypothetical protein
MLRSALVMWPQVWFLGLLGIWALLLFGGFVLGKAVTPEGPRMPTWTRMASSAALVLAAWSAYALDVWIHGPAVQVLTLSIALGMTLGALGDLLLAQVIPMPQPTLWGMIAFGLGHVAYVGGMLAWGWQQGIAATLAGWAAWLVWVLAGVAGWDIFVYRGQRCTALHWAALPYALLLASTAGVATGLALHVLPFVSLAVGAALFLVSDLILAAHLFCGLAFRSIDDVIWLTYGPGQMLIVYALILPRLLPGSWSGG